MRRATLPLILCTVLAPRWAAAQDAPPAVVYEISFENRVHHEARVSVTFPDVGPGTLAVVMSRSSPGRYALHEFAKNVYDFRATDGAGAALRVERPTPYEWDVTGHEGSVQITYTLYGDWADGTYVGIDRTHAHLNMPATFMWARGLEERPIELVVRIPDGAQWRVATQLASTEDPVRFTAPDLAYFMDSPTEVSAYWERRWDVDGQSVGVALHHAGTEAEAEEYAGAIAAIVNAASEIYGELPDFDYGAYTFLADYLPWVPGDAMEHRNSTVLTSSGSLALSRIQVLRTAAHEFFHAWNMERIRSSSLEPFDFEAANMSGELWFGEGFTNYYDDLILWRAGLIGDEDFVTRMGQIVDPVVNARGRRYFSPIEMSMQAPFVDAATSVDPQNFANTFLSYYTWGSGIALGLDLTLRTRFEGLTLDDLMREMWAAFGSGEVHYDVDDIEAALARVSGDAGFARDFFDRFVRGRDVPDFVGLLEAAGVHVGLTRPGAAWLGERSLRFSAAGAAVVTTPLLDTPLYEGGLDRGDVLVSVDGVPVPSRDALESILAGHRPGDDVELRYLSRGESVAVTVRLAEDPALSARPMSGGGSDAQRSFLARWHEGSTR